MPARISPQPKPVEPPAPARRPATPPPASFAEVINLWPSANDLAVVLDVEAVTVRAWRRRDIPARYWSAVAQAARVTNRPVDERLLAELASVRRARLAPAPPTPDNPTPIEAMSPQDGGEQEA